MVIYILRQTLVFELHEALDLLALLGDIAFIFCKNLSLLCHLRCQLRQVEGCLQLSIGDLLATQQIQQAGAAAQRRGAQSGKLGVVLGAGSDIAFAQLADSTL